MKMVTIYTIILMIPVGKKNLKEEISSTFRLSISRQSSALTLFVYNCTVYI